MHQRSRSKSASAFVRLWGHRGFRPLTKAGDIGAVLLARRGIRPRNRFVGEERREAYHPSPHALHLADGVAKAITRPLTATAAERRIDLSLCVAL
jgi:hypothetical protein